MFVHLSSGLVEMISFSELLSYCRLPYGFSVGGEDADGGVVGVGDAVGMWRYGFVVGGGDAVGVVAVGGRDAVGVVAVGGRDAVGVVAVGGGDAIGVVAMVIDGGDVESWQFSVTLVMMVSGDAVSWKFSVTGSDNFSKSGYTFSKSAFL